MGMDEIGVMTLVVAMPVLLGEKAVGIVNMMADDAGIKSDDEPDCRALTDVIGRDVTTEVLCPISSSLGVSGDSCAALAGSSATIEKKTFIQYVRISYTQLAISV